MSTRSTVILIVEIIGWALILGIVSTLVFFYVRKVLYALESIARALDDISLSLREMNASRQDRGAVAVSQEMKCGHDEPASSQPNQYPAPPSAPSRMSDQPTRPPPRGYQTPPRVSGNPAGTTPGARTPRRRS